MVPENEDRHRTAYTVSVDYKHGTTTGISAHDRALTVRALASPLVSPSSFSRPGHMVPLRARPGGVLTRRGHTESALDLCDMTGLPRAGVLCELVEDDEEGMGEMLDEVAAETGVEVRFTGPWPPYSFVPAIGGEDGTETGG